MDDCYTQFWHQYLMIYFPYIYTSTAAVKTHEQQQALSEGCVYRDVGRCSRAPHAAPSRAPDYQKCARLSHPACLSLRVQSGLQHLLEPGGLLGFHTVVARPQERRAQRAWSPARGAVAHDYVATDALPVVRVLHAVLQP